MLTAFSRFWNYHYIYWNQNLVSSESQQYLFAMDLTGRYIDLEHLKKPIRAFVLELAIRDGKIPKPNFNFNNMTYGKTK